MLNVGAAGLLAADLRVLLPFRFRKWQWLGREGKASQPAGKQPYQNQQRKQDPDDQAGNPHWVRRVLKVFETVMM